MSAPQALPAPLRLPVLRLVAALNGLGTIVFLFVADEWRADNPFLLPDLVLALGLGVSAALPPRLAPTALLLAFGFAAGVLGAAAMGHVVRGRLMSGALLGFLTAAGAAALLLAALWRTDVAGRRVR